MRTVRDAVAKEAAEAGLTAASGDDLALAVNELATNSVRHDLVQVRSFEGGSVVRLHMRRGSA